MSKSKARSHLLRLVDLDSDSEDGLGGNAFEATRLPAAALRLRPAKHKTTMPPAKKAAVGRQAGNRVSKPAPKTSASKRRSNDRMAAAADEATDGGRTALGEKSSNAKPSRRGRKRAVAAEEEAEVEENDISMADAPASAVETPPATKLKGARGRPKKAVAAEAESKPIAPRRGRKAGSKKAGAEIEEVSEIPETQQPDAIRDDHDEGEEGDDDDLEDMEDLPAHQSSDRVEPSRSVPAPNSLSKPSPHKLSSDNGDPALRRRLGEMTQKYETLELKYRDLKEIAVKEAERNFDKLRRQSEEKSKGKSAHSSGLNDSPTNPPLPHPSGRPAHRSP